METTRYRSSITVSRKAAFPRIIPDLSSLSGLWYWVIMFSILGIGLVARVWNLENTDMWSDEVLTKTRVQGSLGNAFISLFQAGNQAPIYYLMLRLLPHHTDFLLRLPSVLFGVAGIVLTAQITLKFYQNRILALSIASLLAVNPLYIMLSRQARYYTLLFVLTLIASYYFLLMAQGQDSRSIRRGVWLPAMLAYLTHYTALALPGSQFLFLFLTRQNNLPLVKRWMKLQIIAGFPFLLWVLAMLPQRNKSVYPYPAQIPAVRDLPITILNLLVGYDGTWHWIIVPALVIGLAGIALGVFQVLRRLQGQEIDLYWLLLAFLPMVILFALSVLFRTQYRDRYLLVSMQAVITVFLLGWNRTPRFFQLIGLVVVILSSAYLTANLFHNHDYERSDWTTATETLTNLYRPGDEILFDRPVVFQAFNAHYHASSDLLRNVVLLTKTKNTAAVEATANRIWVIYSIRNEDFHQQDWVNNEDPFQPGAFPLADWLFAHQDRLLCQKPFKGGTFFLFAGGQYNLIVQNRGNCTGNDIAR